VADTEKIHLLFEAFFDGFVHPLFTGGVAQQVRAIAPGCLEHFGLARATDPDKEFEVLRAMHERAAEICPVGALPFPDHGVMAIAAAAHDLAMLTDPQLDRAISRGARPTVLAWVDEIVAAIRMPTTRGALLARHVMLETLLAASREDTKVTNWAYTYRFYGRPPPANVVAMPKLRAVREEKTKKNLLELLLEHEDLDLRSRVRQLVSRSPVTELLRSELCPDLQFGAATLAALSDSTLRTGIVQEIVKQGTGDIAQPFGHALRLLSAIGPPPEYLYVALVFLAELQLLEVMDARKGHQPKSEPAVGAEELFAAVLPALFLHEGALRPVLDLAEPDLDKVRQRAEERRRQAGADAVEFARAIMNRAQPLHSQSRRPAVGG